MEIISLQMQDLNNILLLKFPVIIFPTGVGRTGQVEENQD